MSLSSSSPFLHRREISFRARIDTQVDGVVRRPSSLRYYSTHFLSLYVRLRARFSFPFCTLAHHHTLRWPLGNSSLFQRVCSAPAPTRTFTRCQRAQVVDRNVECERANADAAACPVVAPMYVSGDRLLPVCEWGGAGACQRDENSMMRVRSDPRSEKVLSIVSCSFAVLRIAGCHVRKHLRTSLKQEKRPARHDPTQTWAKYSPVRSAALPPAHFGASPQ